MKNRKAARSIRVAGAAAVMLAAAAPLKGQTSLTIYNDGRVLVRRSVALSIPKGSSSQTLALGAVDPASLFSLDSTVAITRFAYDGAVDEASALRRSVGKRIVFQTRFMDRIDTVSALVLGVDPLRLQLPDGRVTFNPPGAALYPADVVVAEPTVRLGLESEQPRKDLRLGYFTTGASWQASYQVVLGPRDARVTGMAVLESQALRIEDAEVQLLAGAVGRADKQMPPQPLLQRRAELAEARAMDAYAGQQRVGEFHVYSLPGRSTLLPGLTTSIALFEPPDVPYEKSYVVHGAVPYWGILPQQGEEEQPPVEVVYTLKRPRKTAFGDRPIPGGVARLFEADSSGRHQLVGEAAIEHTPAGQDLRLSAGNAFDITARRVQTSYVTRRDSSKAGWRTVATADYRVTVRNATDSMVTVDVQEERGGEWTVVSSSIKAEKLSSTRTRWRVKVPARGEAQVTYRLRIVWW
jgi:hypothetical protein